MTTTLVLNLIDAVAIVTALIGVCRLAFRVAGGLLDPRQLPAEAPAARETEQLAA